MAKDSELSGNNLIPRPALDQKPSFLQLALPVAVILGCCVAPFIIKQRDTGLNWLFILVLSWAVGSLMTPLAIKLSFLFGWLDVPKGRKAHSRATPVLGGLAVVSAFGVALLFTFTYSLAMKGIGIAAFLIWLLGVVDDKYELPAKLKLLVQVIAVSVLVYAGVRVTFLPNVWWGDALELIITFVWVIGVTNAVNFLDGMDGLAGGMGAVIALFLALVAIQSSQMYFAYVAIAFLGATLAFLPFNFRPGHNAAIFLGDNGATFIGFTLASTALMGDWAENKISSLAVPILLFGVPIYDMMMTTITRVATGKVRSFGEWLSYAGRDHFHHRLSHLGIGKARAVIIIWFVTIFLGISAIVLKQVRGIDAILIVMQAGLLFLLISYFMIRVRNRQINMFIEAQKGFELGGNLTHEEMSDILSQGEKKVPVVRPKDRKEDQSG